MKIGEMIKPVIIGGGISGLATGLALRNILGISSTILERNSSDHFENSSAGAGAQIGPNGLRALKAIGGEKLMQKCINAGTKIRGNAIILSNGADPMLIPDAAEAETGLPQIFIRWGILRKILADELPRDLIVTNSGSNICGFEKSKNGDINLLTNENKVIDKFEANLIVSAEGVRSVFRYLINNDLKKVDRDEDLALVAKTNVKDTGRVNIKAIVPRDLDRLSFRQGYTYVWFAPDGGIGCFAGPAGEGYTYWGVSVADIKDETTGKTIPFLSDLENNDRDMIKSKLLKKLNDLNHTDCKFAMDLIKDSSPSAIYFSRSEESTIGPSLQKYGEVVLVGDSAHAMSGSYGQNPNFALEDAAVLAHCIRDSDSIDSALESYSKQRVERCLEMQKKSAERAAKAMKGEKTEDISKWIHEWDVP